MTDFLQDGHPINREYKNDLFVFLFGHHKDLALSLYNAMNNTSYDDPEEIIFNTIEDFIYIGRKNDVSFLIENTINVYEHQTTINANIALRMLMYIAKLYDKFAEEYDKDLYSTKEIKLPNPSFIVFYFGNRECEDDRFVYLSDAMEIKNPNLELRVRVINANYGHSQHILNRCPALYEYSWFLSDIRVSYNKYVKAGIDNREAMRRAVDEALEKMPESFIIKKIILVHKAEVTDMLFTIEDEPRMMKIHEDTIRNETRAEDLAVAIQLLMEAGLSEEEATRRAEEAFSDNS